MDNLQVGLGTKVDSLREELSTKMDNLQVGFDSLQAGVASESFGKFKQENYTRDKTPLPFLKV